MLEEMSAFFTARLNGYDQHMLRDVAGCREGYEATDEGNNFYFILPLPSDPDDEHAGH